MFWPAFFVPTIMLGFEATRKACISHEVPECHEVSECGEDQEWEHLHEKRLSQSSELTGWPFAHSREMIHSSWFTCFYWSCRCVHQNVLFEMSNLHRRNMGIHGIPGNHLCPCLWYSKCEHTVMPSKGKLYDLVMLRMYRVVMTVINESAFCWGPYTMTF
jgi:hypothetical protein